jgi:LmbE family N-acetylglucosaminyl deacetylase
MAHGITYHRRTPAGLVAAGRPEQVFENWQGEAERWMFLSAHDDDVVIGAGVTFQAAMAEGVAAHAVIATDGRMGYCRLPQRRSITQVRQAEAQKSYESLGLPPERLHFLKFPDCNLNPYRGRHFATIGDPTEVEGASGLQNAFPHILRQIRPTRVFLPTISDLHPDHRIVNEEMLISLFHAQGSIWPELGGPIAAVPLVYEYATYCDFPEPPQLRIAGPPEMLDRKIQAIQAFASQEQIEVLVAEQRKAGPVEYLREVRFKFYSPKDYEPLFLPPGP